MENTYPPIPAQSPMPAKPASGPASGNWPRIFGVVMAVPAFFAMIWIAVEGAKEYQRVISLPDVINPENMFVNPHDFVAGLALVISLFFGATMVHSKG